MAHVCATAEQAAEKANSGLGRAGFAPPPEFVHFGLTAKYRLTTALARLRERGNPSADGWVRDSLILYEENNPSPPASPYPLPSERAVINCGPL
jgi:hypothetical protein